MKTILKTEKGQSLVEVIIAMTLLIITTSAAMTVVLSSKTLLYMSEGQTKATALAQEGIEIVRNNRNVGCDFNSLAADNGSGCHFIEGDVYGPSNPTKNNSTKIMSGICSGVGGTPPNQIDGFDGFFTRVINLYDLDKSPNMDWVGPSNFNSTFDSRDKYYYVKVTVSWTDKTGPRSTEITTIMLKRWKD